MGAVLEVSTDKEVYSLGEAVIIFLTNVGDEILSGGGPIITIYNGGDEIVYQEACYCWYELEPGEFITWPPWDQTDQLGNQVPLGRYVVEGFLSGGSGGYTDNATFFISTDNDNDDDNDDEPLTVDITFPNNEDIVSGKTNITGIAYDIGGSIKNVYVQIDTNEWQLAEGTTFWSYMWDTTHVEDDRHVITAVSHNGHVYSACVSIAVYTENEEEPDEKKYPDLKCKGSLSWSEIKPRVVVSGKFTIENIGDPESELSWEIDETPTWGDWTFHPCEGEGLKPENGPVTVQVSVAAPDEEEQEQEFSGQVTVLNKNNAGDYEVIDVSLSTPKTKIINSPLLTFLENHPQLFPLLRQILGLI